jgi:hypothetical protein
MNIELLVMSHLKSTVIWVLLSRIQDISMDHITSIFRLKD